MHHIEPPSAARADHGVAPALRVRNVLLGTDAGRARADIVVRGGVIVAIDPAGGEPAQGETVIEAERLIAFPGFVNAHAHSNEQFEQGAYEGEPLEVWLAMAYPPLGAPPVPARWHYLRAMMLAMQSLRSGVTAIHDDFLNGACDPAALDAVLDAYQEAGLRATVAVTMSDRGYLDGLPALRAWLPDALAQRLDQLPGIEPARQQAFFEDALQRLAARQVNRLRLSLGPRGPQRCTPALMRRVAELAAAHGVPVHMHVLESRVQALTARQQYARSFIEVLDDNGLLGPSLSMNHAVWLTQADIDRIAAAGARVVHNPLSNLKLASGLCPIAALISAGVTVGLGTDGAATSDSVDYLDTLRMTALLHRLHPEHEAPIATRIVHMATAGGAATMGWGSECGRLAPGARADITLLDADDPAFLPLNDPARQLCYAATSRCVDTVVVDGRVVVAGGRCTLIDEAALCAEIADAAEEYRQRRLSQACATDPLLPALRAMAADARHQACALPTLNRFPLS